MLCGLRYTLLTLKSQLLLIKQGAVVLLLGGLGTWGLRESILTVKAVLSLDCRAGRIK